MVQTIAHNVMTQPTGTVYLNEPMNKATPELTDKTEPQDAPESDEANPAPNSTESDDAKTKTRYDELKRHYDSIVPALRNEVGDLKSQISELSTKLATSEGFKVPKTKEETKAFADKYPDLVDQIVSLAADVYSKTNAVVEQKLKALEETTKSLTMQQGIQELKKYHADFEQIKDDPRFHDWFGRQSKAVKSLIQSSSPADIALGLDMYKEYAGIKTATQKAEAKKDATREIKTPTTRVQIGEPGKRTYTTSEIDKMSVTYLQQHPEIMEDIVKAQYEGRIVR